MKKKFLGVVLSVAMVATLLAGCGDKKADDTADDAAKEATEAPADDAADDTADDAADSEGSGELIKVGFAQVGHESDWRTASTASAQEVFSEDNGYELSFVDADNDEAAQIEAVNNFIQQEVDYIIIDPIVTTGWDTVLNSAKEAGIPVFVIDRTIDADESLYEAWYGSNFEDEGKKAGAWLQAYLEAKGRADEEINIVTIAGSTGSSAQIGRSDGFNSYVDANDKWKLLAEQDGEFTQAGGQEVMESFLKSYDDIDVVVCHNDNEAWGARDALKAAGKTFGKDGDVIIISFDAVKDGLADVLAGNFNADFECNPLAAPYVEEAIQTLEAGGKIEQKQNFIDEACFQADDTVKSITFGDGLTADMITVTEDVLAERPY